MQRSSPLVQSGKWESSAQSSQRLEEEAVSRNCTDRLRISIRVREAETITAITMRACCQIWVHKEEVISKWRTLRKEDSPTRLSRTPCPCVFNTNYPKLVGRRQIYPWLKVSITSKSRDLSSSSTPKMITWVILCLQRSNPLREDRRSLLADARVLIVLRKTVRHSLSVSKLSKTKVANSVNLDQIYSLL